MDDLAACARAAGVVAVPLLCRELAGICDARRAAARTLIAELPPDTRDRVVRALEAVLVQGDATDAGKAAALGLLSQLGVERTDAASITLRGDPRDVQRRSAEQLAAQLATRADIAVAADLLVHELDPDELCSVVEAMADAAPVQTRQLVDELAARLDLDGAVRSELLRIVAPLELDRVPSARAPRDAEGGASVRSSARSGLPAGAPGAGRPALLAILEDRIGRRVVVIARRGPDGRCRSLAALIELDGALVDCLYEDDVDPLTLEHDIVGTVLDQG